MAKKKAAEPIVDDLAKTKGRTKGHTDRYNADREPSARNLAWYHDWAVKHMRQSEIARNANVSRVTVHKAIWEVDAWVKAQMFDDVVAYRVRQTEAIEQMIAECIAKWSATSDVAYAEEARKLLADIRKMWGMDKPQKIDVNMSSDGEGLERVAGVGRSEAIRIEAEKMLAAASAVDPPQE